MLSAYLGIAGLSILMPGLAFAQSTPAATTVQSSELVAAERLNQQAFELYQQGKYSEAIPLAERALAIRKKVLGDNHPNVATSLNNLAALYESQGRYSQAEPLYRQALYQFTLNLHIMMGRG